LRWCTTFFFAALPWRTAWCRVPRLGATYGSSGGGGAGAAIGGGAIGAGGACCAVCVLPHAVSNAKAEATNNGLASLTTTLSQADRHHDNNNVHIALPFIRLKRGIRKDYRLMPGCGVSRPAMPPPTLTGRRDANDGAAGNAR
jgi:hypothetical protein